MKVYLAGSESREWLLSKIGGGCMRLYLAGEIHLLDKFFSTWVQENSIEKAMKLFLAESGGLWNAYFNEEDFKNVYILQSYYYLQKDDTKIYKICGDFLLDSGAFTFMQNTKNEINWIEYIHKYADFINKNNIEKFFELDIDSIVGYEKVKEYRKLLEDLTGKRCIPVWHKKRGKADFIETCKNYNYVALGGIVSKEWDREEYKYFPWFIDTAHKYKAKIHGLGFTNLEGIKNYHFDSVDSTSWTTGNRFGYIYKFDGKTIIKYDKKENQRLSDSRKVALINFTEWVKFQEYAEKNL